MKFLSHFWYKFLNQLGSFPSARNMLTVEIFDDLKGKGLDISHLGDYSFKNKDVIRLNIHPGENIDVVSDGTHYPFEDETFDKIIMGVKHKKLPNYGVQFHTESIPSQHGHDLIKNFLQLSKK